MGLPWVRMDAGLPAHPKTLQAVGVRGGKAAMAVYQFSVEWSGGAGTDGHIPLVALRMIHGTHADARILVSVGLWDPDPEGDGWWVRNFAQRQETTDVTDIKRAQAATAGRKSGCKRRGHPADCACWKEPPVSLVR